jgi:hypothetical protein
MHSRNCWRVSDIPHCWRPMGWSFVSTKQEPLQIGELQVVPSADSINAMRKEAAARHLADPNRITKSSGPPPPYTGGGRSTAGDPVEHAGTRRADGKDYAASPAPAHVEPPPPAPASYLRRQRGQLVQQMRPTTDGGFTPEPMSSSADRPRSGRYTSLGGSRASWGSLRASLRADSYGGGFRQGVPTFLSVLNINVHFNQDRTEKASYGPATWIV